MRDKFHFMRELAKKMMPQANEKNQGYFRKYSLSEIPSDEPWNALVFKRGTRLRGFSKGTLFNTCRDTTCRAHKITFNNGTTNSTIT